MRGRLPSPDESVVLPGESVDLWIQFLQMRLCRTQPLLIRGFQPPCERATQAGRAFPERDRFGTVRATELLLDECDAFAGDPLLRGRQIIRPRRGQHRLQALGEVFALLE